MSDSPREVMLVGSVPLKPAAAVFQTAVEHLGGLLSRVPDGEQIGWVRAAFKAFASNPALEVSHQVPLGAGGRNPIDIFRLREGFTASDLTLGPYGFAENALNSYGQFLDLRDAGKIPPGLRYAVTMPGPGTSAYVVQLPAEKLLPIARTALLREVENILGDVAPGDLALQLDIAMEAEHEEYRRRPYAWDQPMHEVFDWTLDQMAESVAWLANRIPPEVELGFHICSIWHHDTSAGQDNEVLVDAANAILSRINRPVAYIHIPIIPEHQDADFVPLGRLQLSPETKLFLGLINLSDGVEGARRRIAAAEKVVTEFGVASFCGLGFPVDPSSIASAAGQSYPTIAALRRATPETIGEVLDLHRAIAKL